MASVLSTILKRCHKQKKNMVTKISEPPANTLLGLKPIRDVETVDNVMNLDWISETVRVF